MDKKTLLIIFILIVSLSGLMLVGTLTDTHGWGDDYAGYILQAESIIEGKPRAYLESNSIALEQSSEVYGPTAYPWGYPLLLAPIYALFGLNFLALKSVAAISYLLFLVALWFVFHKEHSPPWFLILVCLFAFNPRMLDFANIISSDLPFLLVSTIGIWIIQEVIAHKRQIFSPLIDLILIGIIITTGFLLRTNGILLLVTLLLTQIIMSLEKKSNKQQSLNLEGAKSTKHMIIVLTPYIIFLCSVFIWKLFLP